MSKNRNLTHEQTDRTLFTEFFFFGGGGRKEKVLRKIKPAIFEEVLMGLL